MKKVESKPNQPFLFPIQVHEHIFKGRSLGPALAPRVSPQEVMVPPAGTSTKARGATGGGIRTGPATSITLLLLVI